MPDDDDQEDLVPRSHIKQLEQDAKDARELKARFAEMERRAAFSEALGSAAVDPKNRYFIKGYDGDLTTEAIKAEALEAGVLEAASQQGSTDQNNPTPAEMAAHARMAASADGSGGNKPIDLIEAFGPRGSKKPDEILAMYKAAGGRLIEDQQ